MNLNLWLMLSHAEKVALERAHDFGITDQHIQDVIRRRGAKGTATVESLTACTKDEQDHLAWLRSRKLATKSDAFDRAIACQVTRIAELDDRLTALSAEPITVAMAAE